MLSLITPEFLAFTMFIVTIGFLLAGYPVAFTLAGSAVLFALVGVELELFNLAFLSVYPLRILGTMKNEALVAIPLFVFMGIMLEKSNLAGRLLEAMSRAMVKLPGGLGISVVVVGALLAASTGIVGATVVTMGLMSLPVMQKAGYDPKLSTGLICASGTLGQIIPPSIVLILLGDVLQQANEQAASKQGILVPEPVTAIDLFAGALIPGLLMVGLYIAYQLYKAITDPASSPKLTGEMSLSESGEDVSLIGAIVPPLILILVVLGSILAGIATPTESAAIGAVGATLLALRAKSLSFKRIYEVASDSIKVTSMVFFILLGASMFSLVFRGLGGDVAVEHFLEALPGGRITAFILVMSVMFLLGFFLDFIEIIFMIVPIVGPILIAMGFSPLWLGVMIGLNLQTSFLTPPFGFALFYLRGVAPDSIKTSDIYKGVVPFIGLQFLAMILICIFPALVTWLPKILF